MNDSDRNELRRRLDALAGRQTNDVRLSSPAHRLRPEHRARLVLAGAFAVLALIVGGLVWRGIRAGGPDDVVVADRGSDGAPATEPQPEPTTDEAVPAATDCADPNAIDTVVELLRSGMPQYDIEPAGSFGALSQSADAVVAGKLTGVQRLVANQSTGESYTVLTVDGITSLDSRSIADLTGISYISAWNDPSQPDPLVDLIELTGVDMVAFVHLDRTFPGGLRIDGPESLYVACGTDTPASPVYVSAAGADDPPNATLSEIAEMVRVADDAKNAAQNANAAQDARDGEVVADALVRFARAAEVDFDAELPFADEVALALGDTVEKTATRDELRNPDAWRIDREEFNAYAGPFSALQTLADGPATQVTIGEHPRCAADPTPAPAGFEDHLQISIQPADGTIDSCIQWFAVDLFVDPDTGLIDAVTLDLYEP